MLKFIKSLYLSERLFLILLAFVATFVTSYLVESIFIIVKYAFLVFLLIIVTDILLLYSTQGKIEAERLLPGRFSNGDENPVYFTFQNHYAFTILLKVIDELPIQFQIRDFLFKISLKSTEKKEYTYDIRPVKRGVYQFGRLNVYAETRLGLIRRKFIFAEKKEIAVYPSFLQLHKYDLKAFTNQLQEYGLKKIRKIGSSTEFDNIREYVQGDDVRNINWKATAKRNSLMVNQYQDDKAQPVYSVIDKGRIMMMPFAGLSLLDYAINSSLVISNIALKKDDKAGIFTFSRKVENRIVADRRRIQMNLILENLYNIETDFSESDFERLYIDIKRNVSHRSLLFLYTNFENMDSLQRQIPYLRAIAKNYLLVVVFFKNTELKKITESEPKNVREIYHKIIAEKFDFDKKLIVTELNKYGIQAILTEPQQLTIEIINKYLELKARGLI